MISPGAQLRAILAEPGIMIAPGVYDGFSLRLVEQMGYKTANITGAGISTRAGWNDTSRSSAAGAGQLAVQALDEAFEINVVGSCHWSCPQVSAGHTAKRVRQASHHPPYPLHNNEIRPSLSV